MDTKIIGEECLTYARRYRCSLHDAMAEWEGEDENGGFGLTSAEKSELAQCFDAMGMDMDAVRNVTEVENLATAGES